MTLFAGIISRNDRAVPLSTREALRKSISRRENDHLSFCETEHSYFVKLDIGAFDAPGMLRDSNGNLSLLAGEPLLSISSDAARETRDEDLKLIHRELTQDVWDILRTAEGTFCVAFYQPRSGTLNLIADKLGVRPLYYWMDDDYVVFASALRILENLPLVPKTLDVRAVTEIVALGAPLNARSPYVNVSVLKPAEILRVSGTDVSRHCYWRWDEIEPSVDPERQRLQAVYRSFQSAVRRRLRRATEAVGYLSGGLDSRCVIAALVDQGAHVHTFNFARPGTQDQTFGDRFAESIGSIHRSLPKKAGDQIPDYATLLSRAWNAIANSGIEKPTVAWSGEGGSVALGYVHMNQAIVDLMRAGNIDDAIDEFFRQEYVSVPRKLFKPKTLKAIDGIIKQGVKEELNDLHATDPARNFYLFLMLNDQRRKLSSHFENIDLHRVEFQLPFFDAAFLASVMTVPVDSCLYHKFYTKWLALFPPAVTSTPWQTYPDHEPCPLPVPTGLAYQWDDEYQTAQRAAQKQTVLRQAEQFLTATDFPRDLMSKPKLRLATWIHAKGWRDYEHVITAAHTYYSYWAVGKRGPLDAVVSG